MSSKKILIYLHLTILVLYMINWEGLCVMKDHRCMKTDELISIILVYSQSEGQPGHVQGAS
jgi:hypothetical protein